ncbi:hypothetical protein ROA7450_02642 [Roseovarius albus]|uniref:Flp/Fap pilin component n=1 Tax=Roseovarius albus TaxID=1247867 RepID=A0A1X6ZJ49_9RHOB|nr:hypothetical protein [Roseovarius albus]SLN52526.1 hypothetical protein ROA7450_02642 [Roseovarius albus]
MQNYLKKFRADELGAVTVDWVVLTAIVVSLAAAAFSGVEGGVGALTQKLLTYLQSLTVGT